MGEVKKLSSGRAAMLAARDGFKGHKNIGALVAAGLLEAVEAEKGVFVLCRKFNEWEEGETQALARGLSCALSGQFHYSQYQVVRVAGRSTEVVLSESGYRALVDARMVADLIGLESALTLRTVGRIGRSLVDFICGSDLDRLNPDDEHKMSVKIAEFPSWGAFRVEPGEYENMVHLDVAGYYHGIARKIADPLPMWSPTGVLMFRNAGRAKKRWRTVVDHVGLNKQLRNTLIGQMCSGSDDPSSWYFVKGEQLQVNSRPSKLAALGHLIVRCGTEMSLITSKQTSSVYTCVDCVICPDTVAVDLGGTYWEQCGFEVRRKGAGRALVYNLANYSIKGGRKMRADVTQKPVTMAQHNPPKMQYHKEVFKI